MKTTTLVKKHSEIRNANNRTVRVSGQTFLIRSQSLGKDTLADFEPMPLVAGRKPVSLFSNTVLAKSIRAAVEMRLFT